MTAVDERTRITTAAEAAENEDFWTSLIPEAADLVVTAAYASEAMLSRKMRVGHAMAGDLLVELADLGVVAPGPDGTWRVVVDAEQVAEILADLAADLDSPPDVVDGVAPGVADPPHQVATPPLADLAKTPPSDLAKGGATPSRHPGGEGGDGTTSHARHPGDHPGGDLVEIDDGEWWEDDHHGGELAIRQAGEVAIRPLATLVTLRQAGARHLRWVGDQQVVVRGGAVARQLPRVGWRLTVATPRGAARMGNLAFGWLRDDETRTLMAHHSTAHEGDTYERVAKARVEKDLAGRRRVAAMIAGVVGMIAAAWWAPLVFAAALAVLVGTVGVVVSLRHHGKQILHGLALATGAAWAAWHWGDDLAATIPQPPWWVWPVLGVAAVATFGWMGRHEGEPLIDMPHAISSAPEKPPPITAPMIVEALFRIGVPSMTPLAADKGMRDEIRVIAPGVAVSTHGYVIELELPPGVTAEMVVSRRGPLAGALRRDLGCVWPSGKEDRHPGYLRLFISHKPMNKAVQPVWPLAVGNPVDIFEPMPLFTDEEMRWVSLTLAGTPHLAVGGASGFGKSVWLRQVSCGVAFDLRVRIVVIDGKRSGDLDHVRKLAHAFHEGADVEDVEAVAGELRSLVQEYLKRSKFLSALPPDERSPKVTSALASKYPAQLSPIVVFYDEVQEGTQYGVKGNPEDKKIREEITGQLTRLSRVGRSAGIYLILASQRPEADVIPSSIMGNCSIRVAFKVSDQTHNDQILGTSARKNGIDATMFGTRDKGMAWLKGGDDVDAQVVRSWSEMVDVGVAIELADKAYALRKAAGLLTGQAADDGVVDAEIVYDIVRDAEQVMRGRGCGKAQWDELVGWLREMRPGQYGELSARELSASVRTAGVRVRDVRSGDSVRKGVHLSDLGEQGSDDDD